MINIYDLAEMYGQSTDDLAAYGDSVLRDDLSEVGIFVMTHPYAMLVNACIRPDGMLISNMIPESAVVKIGRGNFDDGAALILSHLIETDRPLIDPLPRPDKQ